MRTIALLILALTASSVVSTCPGDNFINLFFDYTLMASTATEAAPSTSDVCGFKTASTAVCCADTTLDEFQTRADSYVDVLDGLSADKDEYLITQRGEVTSLSSSLNRINDALEQIADEAGVDDSSFDGYLSAYQDYIDIVVSNFTGLVANFDEYQTARKTCFETLVKAQVAVWCASCQLALPTGVTDDNSGGTAVAGAGTVSFDDTLNTQISGDCYDYIQYSANQSAIIVLSGVAKGIAALADALEAFANGDATAAAEALTSVGTGLTAPTFSSTATQTPVVVPTDCTADDACPWVETDLFTSGYQLINNTAIMGGDTVSISISSSRRLKEGKERRLTGTGLTQDLTALGVTVTVAKNPGNVDNTENSELSALRNGIVAVAVAALALF